MRRTTRFVWEAEEARQRPHCRISTKSPDSRLAPAPPRFYGTGMDPDYIAFRALVRQAETDPALAAELARAMSEGWPLSRLLSLASSADEPATFRESRTPASGDDGQ